MFDVCFRLNGGWKCGAVVEALPRVGDKVSIIFAEDSTATKSGPFHNCVVTDITHWFGYSPSEYGMHDKTPVIRIELREIEDET